MWCARLTVARCVVQLTTTSSSSWTRMATLSSQKRRWRRFSKSCKRVVASQPHGSRSRAVFEAVCKTESIGLSQLLTVSTLAVWTGFCERLNRRAHAQLHSCTPRGHRAPPRASYRIPISRSFAGACSILAADGSITSLPSHCLAGARPKSRIAQSGALGRSSPPRHVQLPRCLPEAACSVPVDRCTAARSVISFLHPRLAFPTQVSDQREGGW